MLGFKTPSEVVDDPTADNVDMLDPTVEICSPRATSFFPIRNRPWDRPKPGGSGNRTGVRSSTRIHTEVPYILHLVGVVTPSQILEDDEVNHGRG